MHCCTARAQGPNFEFSITGGGVCKKRLKGACYIIGAYCALASFFGLWKAQSVFEPFLFFSKYLDNLDIRLFRQNLRRIKLRQNLDEAKFRQFRTQIVLTKFDDLKDKFRTFKFTNGCRSAARS
jgi:hypothetical protein